MKTKLEFLSNGIPVIMTQSLDSNAVNVTVAVRAGSRYETKEQSGIAHFLEHMFFKGAKKYTNAKQISEAIDRVGGDFNAFTSREYVGFYIKTAKKHMNLSFDMLSDMLLCSQFNTEEIEKERKVILEEIRMYDDMPQSKAAQEFDTLFYGDHPLGWDIAGTEETVNSFQREDLMAFQKELYTTENMIISVSGNIDYQYVLKQLEIYFQSVPSNKKNEYKSFAKNITQTSSIYHRSIQQAHIIVGFPTEGFSSYSKYALKLLSTILGGNMSSRLFQKLREDMGLCYYVNASKESFEEIGCFSFHAGVDVQRVEKAIDAIDGEIKLIKEKGITQQELDDALSYTEGQMALYLEDADTLSHYTMQRYLIYGEICTWEDSWKEYKKVSVEDINKIAQNIFDDSKKVSFVLGPDTMKLNIL